MLVWSQKRSQAKGRHSIDSSRLTEGMRRHAHAIVEGSTELRDAGEADGSCDRLDAKFAGFENATGRFDT